ncbi:subtilisin-like serine protease precursor, partial [Metarhizium majus ARSEF 297]
MAVEKFASLDKKMSAKEWSTIWSGEIKPGDWGNSRCEEIDRLELDIHLKDEAWAGTNDALDLVILGEFIGKTSHSIHMGRDMNRGWRHREKIPMSSLNNGQSTFTGARHITGLELRSASGDRIKLEIPKLTRRPSRLSLGIKVTAKCANSSAKALIDRKWESINQWVEADKQSYGKIWYGAIKGKDWSWRPPCYEFDELKVAFHLVDAAWAGTDGRIEVNFNLNGPRTKLAENPNRNHRDTVNIDLATVFNKKVISVDEIKVFDIWTGTNEIYVDSLQLFARCAKSGKQAVFNRYKSLDTKMVSSSLSLDSVWTGKVDPTGWEAK